ncbi:MAG TPA: hypothetical protein VIM64_04500, partial [Puia sp.]
MIRLLLCVFLLWGSDVSAQRVRWGLSNDGGIDWKVDDGSAASTTHVDHLEMAGKGIAVIVTYGIDGNKRLVLQQHLVFPGLRKLPNDTRGSYTLKLAERMADSIRVDGEPIIERPAIFYIRGVLRIVSRTQTPLVVQRTIFPSVDKRAYVED